MRTESNISTTEFAQKVFWLSVIPFNPVTDIAVQILSNLLCLETLTHGTSIGNYLNIRVHGADPRLGGSEIGSSRGVNSYTNQTGGWEDKSKGFIHVWKDSGIVNVDCKCLKFEPTSGKSIEQPRYFSYTNRVQRLIIQNMIIPWLPRIHAVLSGYAFPYLFHPGDSSSFWLKKEIFVVLSFFAPTVKFRFLPDKVNAERYHNFISQKISVTDSIALESKERFQEDPDNQGIAWKTSKAIGLEHIGLWGVIQQGSRGNWTKRVRKYPHKFFLGIAQIFLVISISALMKRIQAI